MSEYLAALRRQTLEKFDSYFSRDESNLKLRHGGFAEREPGGATEAWFLGPKGENEKLLRELLEMAVAANKAYRQGFKPDDPPVITDAIKQGDEYKATVARIRASARTLFTELQKSTPVFSMRHQGHMLWDQVLPATVGYVGAMLYNQNNVAAEASPVTTYLEIEVGNDLCRMIGFDVPVDPKVVGDGTIVPWGHLTCDGTVANVEALWAARNLKFLPTALRAAILEAPGLERATDLGVPLRDGTLRKLVDLEPWTLLNLAADDVASLPHVMSDRFDIELDTITDALASYALPSLGWIGFERRFPAALAQPPVVLVPATRHYSWPKAATLLGIGTQNLVAVDIDVRGRMKLDALRRQLTWCLERRVPVIAVVAVIGSTEESAVDPLGDILDMREDFRARGLDFIVHCDAAWGGYFNAMMRRDGDESERTDDVESVPTYPMSAYVRRQYRALRGADSVTVDPHKAGYVPYPAGGLCYRNSALRDAISLKSPVVFHSQLEPTVGIYGVEGSKPGAAAAAAYLAHRVIPPTRSGYGKLLGQCMWTSKRFYCLLATMEHSDLKITTFQELPAEREGAGSAEVEAQRKYIREAFVPPTNEDLRQLLRHDGKANALFAELGSDQIVLAYSFNFRDRDGWNRDIARCNRLNAKIFELCSVTDPKVGLAGLDLILTSSDFDPALYGAEFVDRYARRLGLDPVPGVPIDFLISTTMNPWPTDVGGVDFLTVIVEALQRAAARALDEIGLSETIV